MRFRAEDDKVVGFGHFSEARRVKSGPNDVIPHKSDGKASGSLGFDFES